MQFPVFEVIMLICFGAAWPVAIRKSWSARSAQGKSRFFLFIILIGYLSGMIHKLWWQETTDAAVWLYLLNAIMVSVDAALTIRNKILDRRRAAAVAVPG